MGDGPRYFRVSPRFWDDAASWSDDAKLLALYILTCHHRTSEGLFRLPKAYAREDMEWSQERFDEGFRELLEVGFIDYDEAARVVLIRKALKYQAPANENIAKAAVTKLEELPETRLWQEFRQLAEQYAEQLAKQLQERFGELTPDPQALSLAPTQAQEPPGGEADASANGHDPRRLAERWRDHATNELGLQLPPAERLSERFRFVLEIMLDEIGDENRHGNVIGFVVDYIELACGGEHRVTSGERAFLARCVAEFDPLKVFDAAVQSVTWGAGTGEYADHPKAVVAYMRSVLGKQEATP